MKLFTLGLMVAIGLSDSFELKQDTTSSWIRRQHNKVRKREYLGAETKPVICSVFEQERLYINEIDLDQHDQDPAEWYCRDEYGHFYKIDGLAPDFFSNIASGSTILKSDKSIRLRDIENEDDRIIFISHPTIESIPADIKSPSSSDRRSLLVIRVISLDGQPERSATQIADDVFGIHGDQANLASQYKACSGGKLQFLPATEKNIVNGVLEVMIWRSFGGVPIGTAANAAQDAAEQIIGPVRQFKHYMIILQSSVDFGGSLAVGYGGGNRSVYKDTHASKLLPQMHELGHNLGLHHSGEEGKTYRDRTCMMGAGQFDDDKPSMCFNAHKSWYLGWYDDRHVTVNPAYTWEGKLVGIDDYLNGQSIRGRHHVIVRIEQKNSDDDLYLMYNRKEGVNRDVLEHGDKVTIVSGHNGKTSKQSWLLAALGPGDVYRMSYFNGQSYHLIIEVCAMVMGWPDYSFIIISVNNDINKLHCSGRSVFTDDPTMSPTPRPTNNPTTSPTARPTNNPTTSPTPSPTRSSSPTSICSQLITTLQQNCKRVKNCCTLNSDGNSCGNALKCPDEICKGNSKQDCFDNNHCCQWKKNKCRNTTKCSKGCPVVKNKCPKSGGCCKSKNGKCSCKMNSESGTDVIAPQPSSNQSCSNNTDKKSCRKSKKCCKWNGVCSELLKCGTPQPSSNQSCSINTDKKSCRKSKNCCKWNGVCDELLKCGKDCGEYAVENDCQIQSQCCQWKDGLCSNKPKCQTLSSSRQSCSNNTDKKSCRKSKKCCKWNDVCDELLKCSKALCGEYAVKNDCQSQPQCCQWKDGLCSNKPKCQ